jgi:hypothetical protein
MGAVKVTCSFTVDPAGSEELRVTVVEAALTIWFSVDETPPLKFVSALVYVATTALVAEEVNVLLHVAVPVVPFTVSGTAAHNVAAVV